MKEQVAEILGNMAHEVKQCGSKDPALGLAIKQATLQICQLSQERVERIKSQFAEAIRELESEQCYGFPQLWQALKKKELK